MQGVAGHICGSCGVRTSVSRCIRAMQTMRNAACGASQGRTRSLVRITPQKAGGPAERTLLISLLVNPNCQPRIPIVFAKLPSGNRSHATRARLCSPRSFDESLSVARTRLPRIRTWPHLCFVCSIMRRCYVSNNCYYIGISWSAVAIVSCCKIFSNNQYQASASAGNWLRTVTSDQTRIQ